MSLQFIPLQHDCSTTLSFTFKLALTTLHVWFSFAGGRRAGTRLLHKHLIRHCSLGRRHFRGNTSHGVPALHWALLQPFPSGQPARVKGEQERGGAEKERVTLYSSEEYKVTQIEFANTKSLPLPYDWSSSAYTDMPKYVRA